MKIWWLFTVRFCYVIAAFVILTLSGCGFVNDFAGTSAEVTQVVEPLNLPWQTFIAVSWVNENKIAFLVGIQQRMENILDGKLAIFDLRLGVWEEINTDSFVYCLRYRLVDLTTLPDGTLGIVAHCYTDDALGTSGKLYQYDLTTKQGSLLYEYEPRFIPGGFSFYSSLDTWLQERRVDDRISNELYIVKQVSAPIRLVEHFQRARDADWLDSDSIVFFGTEASPGNLQTFDQVAEFVRSPWSLYELSTKTGELTTLIEAVRNVGSVQRIPTTRKVAFVGEINGRSGIWTLDVSTKELIRIWDTFAIFSWSPEGNSLVVASVIEGILGYEEPNLIWFTSENE